jgi:cell division protein FtsZ
LLNDNDIQGARWILININSCEGEHEFTMDEVEIIQNYLIERAGEGTDVILGLGYDNTLGSAIGITLIATGFEHKDPFAKTLHLPKEEKKEDKIVLSLDMPAKEETKTPQPVAQAEQAVVEMQKEETVIETPKETAPEKIVLQLAIPDMPEVKEPVITTGITSVDMKALTPENQAEPGSATAPVFFEISSSSDQVPTVVFDIPETPAPAKKEEPAKEPPVTNVNEEPKKEASTSVSSAGGYLAKPQTIYAYEEKPQPESNTTEELTPLQSIPQADEPVFEMQMVVKDSHQAAEEKPIAPQTQHPLSMSPVEEPAVQDEAEELRRRAAERIAKLRNLSFNINAADPNNEFESVPAYLRRNMELHNSLADVESFYSNYQVKTDENNQAEISTINTFLDGKKPD